MEAPCQAPPSCVLAFHLHSTMIRARVLLFVLLVHDVLILIFIFILIRVSLLGFIPILTSVPTPCRPRPQHSHLSKANCKLVILIVLIVSLQQLLPYTLVFPLRIATHLTILMYLH